MLNRITFSPSDYEYPNLETVANDIASFLFRYKSKIDDFCELMRISGTWTLSTYKNELLKWEASKLGRRKRNAAADTIALMKFCHDFFDICQTDIKLQKMRGLVPEKLTEMIFKLRYKDRHSHLGFGVVVNINGKPVRYNCSNPYNRPDDSDAFRQSVDAGAWDGNVGEFAEVKFRPQAFHTKDINYLRTLSQELVNNKIDYYLFLICFDDKDLTAEKLKELYLWKDNEFTLIGREEVFELQIPAYAA